MNKNPIITIKKIKPEIGEKQGLFKRQQINNFDNYITYNEKQKSAIKKIRNNIDKSFLFYGNSGTGKGHIAISVLKEKIYEGKTGKYVLAFDLFLTLKTNFLNAVSIMEYYSNVDILIVDEIEKIWRSGRENEKDIFFAILNKRYENYKQTILITNIVEWDEILKLLGVSIVDRMAEIGIGIKFDWESYRRKKRENKK